MAKRKILVIDDEPSITRLLKFVLEKTGLYDVTGENESTKALALIRSAVPDLLVLDMNMPGISGVEIAEAVKTDPSLKKLQIVFLTGNISDEEAEAGMVIDGYPAIGKPINMERLIERVGKSLS